jgi:hypothetical protein
LLPVRCTAPEGALFGIEEIVLEEQVGPATATSPDWHHNIEGRNLAVGGQYFRPQGNAPASIVLYMANWWEIAFCLDPNHANADCWYYEAKKALALKERNGTTDLLKTDF